MTVFVDVCSAPFSACDCETCEPYAEAVAVIEALYADLDELDRAHHERKAERRREALGGLRARWSQ